MTIMANFNSIKHDELVDKTLKLLFTERSEVDTFCKAVKSGKFNLLLSEGIRAYQRIAKRIII